MAAPPEAGIISPATNGGCGGGGIRVENCYVFKSRLQEYAQKAGFRTPEYHTVKEGPPHEPIFKSTVVINNTKYDSLPGFFNRKAAEQSAAEVALMEIVKSIPTNASIPAVQETGLCKNLLQEYTQKMNYAIPSYICNKQASSLSPFICTVEIGGIQYIGGAARTKKEAEIKAARTALLAIQGQSEGCANGATKYIVVPGKKKTKEPEKRPIETPKPLKVKRGGIKKKWNKRKFMKNDQAADEEKVEASVTGDVHDLDVPMHPAMSMQEPSLDAIMLHPDEYVRRVEQESPRYTAVVQSNVEATSIRPEPPKCTAIVQLDENATTVEPPKEITLVQPHEEERTVEPERPRYIAMVQPNREARGVEPESLRKTGTMQPNEESLNMEERSCNSAIMQSNEEATMMNQEQPNNALFIQPTRSLFDNQSSGDASLEIK